jgi:hypothetical protein
MQLVLPDGVPACRLQVPGVVEEMVGGKWGPADLLPVNPTGEQLQEMREQLLLKRTAERAAKQEKKKSKAAVAANGGAGEAAAATVGSKRAADQSGAAAAAAEANGGGPAPALTASAAAAKRFKAKELKPKNADDAVWNSLFTSSTKNGGQSNEYMCRGSSRYVA